MIPLVASLLLIPSSFGQEKKYRFEFFGGLSRPMDKKFVTSYPQTTVPVEGTQEFSYGGLGGVRLGIDGRKHWGQDYAYSYGANASRIVTRYGRFAFTNHVHQASTNILFYPWNIEKKTVLPFITGGLGATFATLSQKTISEGIDPLQAGLGALKSETIFAFNAGGGVRIRMSERFGIRLDARDYMSRALRYGLPKTSTDPNAAVLPISGVLHQLAVTASLVIHF